MKKALRITFLIILVAVGICMAVINHEHKHDCAVALGGICMGAKS